MVLNFAILAREYFAVFYFSDFNRQFCDSSVLDFILIFKKSELFKIPDKLEQAKQMKTIARFYAPCVKSMQINVISQNDKIQNGKIQMELTCKPDE